MIPLPQSIQTKKSKDNWALFEIDGLYPGYGTTLGNSLRRVLISSLDGAAVTEVKIKGVSHEFDTIEGVKEDVLHLLLNLKKLRFKIFSDEPQTISLKKKGEGEVKAKDFKTPSQIELVSKDLKIATVTDKKTELDIELKIEKGVGYQLDQSDKKKDIGTIPLDATFTPVRKVNFKVENTRVGKRTDFDKLTLEIETDGTIEPKQALNESLDILLSQFNFLRSGEEALEAKKEEKEEKKTEKELNELDISEKTLNLLEKNKISSVLKITEKTEEELMAIKGLGEKAVKEVKKALKKEGLELKA